MAKKIKEMSNIELDTIDFYSNIEFEIDGHKIILKNINIESFSNMDKYKLIKLLMGEIKWFNVELYGKVEILEEIYMLIERTKNKMILVRELY
ncbi:hypothetical protein [Clostridium butyricum]|uniref:hypothetical protein n=1 Tax=Clostridium butyricum TaxID=1492 RepID=UPI00325A8B15